ncbi:hypothetical protein [Zavarzinia sp. CC-PAN008]|uniref:hypothetical protein n=1 Tax=Zavarzinia sp. CC-PAN008 TaxID=3243332 RepID=UPI003F745829
MSDGSPTAPDDGAHPTWIILVRLVLIAILFVPAWAGANFLVGTALDGPVGAFLMEAPCQALAQRLGGQAEPLERYNLGTAGRGSVSSSVCHFGSGFIRVADGPTEGLGFEWRELAYLALGFVGYAACFVGALVIVVFTVNRGWRIASGRRSHRSR